MWRIDASKFIVKMVILQNHGVSWALPSSIMQLALASAGAA
jgi:hypothetical protein